MRPALLLLLLAPALRAEPLTTAALLERARPSVVAITGTGRDGRGESVGTGFCVGPDLVATNLHVIGEGRAFAVETADGKRLPVLAVHASDRKRDLAVLRVGGPKLPALPLGDSATLPVGAQAVAIGNPRGLRFSVVEGVVSGRREIDGREMLQLAVPLEPGNSGGPVLDREGRVVGVVTLKSALTANLGFAAAGDDLKALLARPNPVPLDRWLARGAPDPAEWVPELGATWRQRVGTLTVTGAGTGFGGRSLCLRPGDVKLPLELSVEVRLNDESGAAGLAFAAGPDLRHYGFYPTGGRLRLVRFDGPDVFSWNILGEVASPAYKPGEWNALSVRHAADGIVCSVNGTEAIRSADTGRTAGRVGLAKFRETEAEFRAFRVGPPPRDALLDQARELEAQAARLRRKAADAREAAIAESLAGETDTLAALLTLSQLDRPEIDPAAYTREVERLAAAVRARTPKDAGVRAKWDALKAGLFTDAGFHGSRDDYHARANADIASVLDDREGLPLSLAVLTVEVARRVGLSAEVVGLPGHAVVRLRPERGEAIYADVYAGGTESTEAEVRARAADAPGGDAGLDEILKKPLDTKAIVTRTLRNLLRAAQEAKDPAAGVRYLQVLVKLDPDPASERLLRNLRAALGL